MLPASAPAKSKPAKSVKSAATAAVLALSLALPAPAFALDRHDQGIVAGAIGVLLLQGLIKSTQTPHTPQAPYTPDVRPVPLPTKPAPVVYVPHVSQTPAAYAFSSYSYSERRAIQRSLARGGFYYGPLDGAFGNGTYNATLSYARATKSGRAMNSEAGAYGIYDRLLYGW
jgi:hypothetical protein